MPVTLPEALRQAMRSWATGVSIVTTTHQGQPYGMTVSSLTSVSLDPPYILVALAHESHTRRAVVQAGHFGITVLAEDQQPLAERFAGQVEGPLRFVGVETFTLTTGAPLLAGGLAFLDCRVAYTWEVGTHTLVVGAVLAARRGHQAGPLLYFDRDYRRLAI